MHKPRISIITVVYNGANTLQRTIDSVCGQTFKDYEYIIIDGASKDGTTDIIYQNRANINTLLSEPDSGLYEAMNKGLKLAGGTYVCFLNAGDTFYSNSTLANVFEGISNDPDIIYGETLIVDNLGNELGTRRLKAPDNLTWHSFKNGMLVCHQSIYVKKEIATNYNLKYSISADYEWVLLALKKARHIHNSQLTLTRFLDGGINKKNIRKGLTERFRIMIAHYGFFSVAYMHLLIGVKFFTFWIKNKRF